MTHFLSNLVTHLAKGFRYLNIFDANSTFCLILFHGNKPDVEGYKFWTLTSGLMDMNLALVYLSDSSKRGG